MFKTVFQNSTPFFKIVFSSLVMIVSFILFFIVGLLIILPFIDFRLTELADVYNNLSNSFNVNLLKYIQGLNTTGLFIIPPFIIAYFMGQKTKIFLNLKFPNNYLTIIYAIVAMLISLPLINFLAEINAGLKLPELLSSFEQRLREAEDNAQFVTDIFVNVETFNGYMVNMLVIAILPAIGEEFIFRGMFQKFFISWTKNKHLGILFAAILFSAFHFQFFGFLPRMLMGVFFGYLLVWSNSIWLPVIAHFINNAVAVTFFYLYNIEFIDVDIENVGEGKDAILVVIGSIVMLAGLIYGIYQNEVRKEQISL